MFRTSMTLDRTTRRMTAISSGIIAVGLAAAASAAGARIGGGAVALIAGVLAVAWAMGPREVVVDGGELRIGRRAWRPLRVPVASITSASPTDRAGRRALRLLGTGGFFGSYGLFWSDALGRFRLYATRTGQAVVVRRSGGRLPIVLTPDDVAGTIAALDRRPTQA